MSVAVWDGVAKDLMVVHPKLRGRTASIVKVDILETLLHKTGGHLTEEQRETATSMIENSDNDSATDLWNQDGGAPGVHAYNDDLGLKQTTPNVDWGLTTTSAADQVTLVRELLHSSPLLTTSGRRFQRTLMRHVEADQQWGISAGSAEQRGRRHQERLAAGDRGQQPVGGQQHRLGQRATASITSSPSSPSTNRAWGTASTRSSTSPGRSGGTMNVAKS